MSCSMSGVGILIVHRLDVLVHGPFHAIGVGFYLKKKKHANTRIIILIQTSN